MLKTSLIITTYNQKDRLSLVLDSIIYQNITPDEIIIADDGSKEDTKELIKSYAKKFKIPLIHSWQEDKGFRAARSRNLAIKKARFEYIIIIDGDMILEKNFIKDHKEIATKNTLIQGSRVILNKQVSQQILDLKDYKLAFKVKNFKGKRISFISRLILKLSEVNASFLDKKPLKGVRSCNMAFFKSDILAINGFSHLFIGWGREDSEFVARFLFNGGRFARLKFGGLLIIFGIKKAQEIC